MNKLSINIFMGFSYEELLLLAHKNGFEAFFSDQEEALHLDKMRKIKKIACENQLEYETSHSTIPGCTYLWTNGDEGDKYANVLMQNIDNCAQMSIKTLVVHIQTDAGMESDFNIGIARLQNVVNYAQNKNVTIAFENINSSEFLYRTLEYFDNVNVGFCYDCGHEACYTPTEDYLSKIGHRLICTHIHDNNKMHDEHLLPFDGRIDFVKMCNNLKKAKYNGNISLELAYNDFYSKKMTKAEFINESFKRAKKLSDLINN